MKIVVRILDSDDILLGWCEHHARLRGDGKLRASRDVVIPIERAGVGMRVSLHWCDVNVETRVPLPAMPFHTGDFITLFANDCVMIDVGPMPGPLPPVTVRTVEIGLPAGQLGARC